MAPNTLHFHYEIVRVLDLGKSGITYLAKDLDLIDSPFYVIKEIQSDSKNKSIDPLTRKLFEVQASIAYKVGQHPQIPSLVGKFVENGHQYLVREYIDGEPLSQELTQDAIWSQTQVFDFLIDLVGILAFVHSFKYIHQDINPHNIIRRTDDDRFNLIGFSSLKDLENVQQHLPDNYFAGYNNSTYIPYEQEQNAPQFNSDLYAVGVVAIQALMGKVPIDRDPETYELKWRDDVKIDARLSKILDRMVRPDYRNRYQSALEVLTDLQSFALSQLPTSKFPRLNPYLIFGAAACTLLCGFGAVKILSDPTNKSQLLPPTVATPKTLNSGTSNNLNWKQYTDKIIGMKIQYANTWHQNDAQNILTGEKAIFISPQESPTDKYQENVSIRVEKLTNPQTTLSSYSESAIAEIQKYYQGVKIIESSATSLSKQPAKLVVYTGKDENLLPIKNLEVWTIDRGKVYILTYKAEPDRYYQYLETAMTMINSFELK
jgi:eukaryotic-like serine/threonine-protein kinase